MYESCFSSNLLICLPCFRSCSNDLEAQPITYRSIRGLECSNNEWIIEEFIVDWACLEHVLIREPFIVAAHIAVHDVTDKVVVLPFLNLRLPSETSQRHMHLKSYWQTYMKYTCEKSVLK